MVCKKLVKVKQVRISFDTAYNKNIKDQHFPKKNPTVEAGCRFRLWDRKGYLLFASVVCLGLGCNIAEYKPTTRSMEESLQ
jgi:hypothetical protein